MSVISSTDRHNEASPHAYNPSSFLLMRGRGAVIRPLDSLINCRRSFKSALRNQHEEVTRAAKGSVCKTDGIASFAGSSPAFPTNNADERLRQSASVPHLQPGFDSPYPHQLISYYNSAWNCRYIDTPG